MEKKQRGIQSIEVGGKLLVVLGRSGTPMVLKDLAAAAEMPPAKAHPYLVSFSKLGLVEQDARSGRYELGPEALQLGLACLQRLDPVRIATEEMTHLIEKIGHTVALAVWGTHGPTVVRLEMSTYPIHVNLRPGSVMSLMNTATGLIFAAYMPPKVIESMLNAEPGRVGGDVPAGGADHENLLSEVRRRGIARAIGNPIPGINAISAPVFDYTNNIVLAITALGTANIFDPSLDGTIAKEVTDFAKMVSGRLGHR